MWSIRTNADALKLTVGSEYRHQRERGARLSAFPVRHAIPVLALLSPIVGAAVWGEQWVGAEAGESFQNSCNTPQSVRIR